MRPIALFLLAILTFAPCALAQSGVLLGMEASSTTQGGGDTEDFASIHAAGYQTVWIAPDIDGQLKVLASIPELIVPRRDGFWHVGVVQVCEFTNGEFPNERIGQVVWSAPVTVGAMVEQSPACTPHKPEDYAPPYMRSDADMHKISQCGFDLVNVQYVSPEIISASDYSSQSEACEPRGGRYSLTSNVRSFESDQSLSFGQLLGPAAGNAYFKAVPKRAKDDTDQDSDCGEPDTKHDVAWEVTHQRGRWHASVNQSLGNFGCSARGPINFPLPASLTGDRVPTFDWKALQSKIEGLKDVFISPTATLLIAVTDSELKFYEFSSGSPGKLLLRLPAKPIVMAQWATGSHVRDWTSQISKLAAQPLPEPVVKVNTSAE